MELNLQKQTITINETIFDGNVEQPVECDAQLPDYCPDISKILKCSVSTHVGGTAVSADRLTVDGVAHIRVFYLPEEGGLRRAEYKVPFSKVVELRSAPHDPVITVSPALDYVNCRAVNQRRIDVRGAVSLSVKVADRRETEIITNAEGAGLQLKSELIQATELGARCESGFNLQEELEVGYGKAAIGTVIRTACTVNMQDYKVVSGKVVAKGEVLLQMSYLPPDDLNKLEYVEYTLPISQIIDCEGVDEQSVCDIEMHVETCDIQAKADEAGEYKSFLLDARIKAIVCAWRQKEVPVAADCYSTLYECSCRQAAVPFLRLEKVLSELVQHKSNLDLPEGVEEVLDLWCDVDRADWKYADEQLTLTLAVQVCMFARMAEDGSCLYFEQAVEVEESFPLSCAADYIQFDPSCDIVACAFTPGVENVELRVDIMVRGCVFCSFQHPSISEIEINETAPKVKEKNKLYLYYAEGGESVWDIAKRYNTSAGAIWEENNVEADILGGKCMLLIPIV